MEKTLFLALCANTQSIVTMDCRAVRPRNTGDLVLQTRPLSCSAWRGCLGLASLSHCRLPAAPIGRVPGGPILTLLVHTNKALKPTFYNNALCETLLLCFCQLHKMSKYLNRN